MIFDTFTITGMVISVVVLAVLFSMPWWGSKKDYDPMDSDTVL
jgi:hypothetical protein